MGYFGQPPYQLVVQTCHFAVACALSQLAVTCGLSGWWGLAWTLAFATAKEWGYDLLVEKDSWQGSLLDYTFYALGMLVSATVFFFSKRF